jgi:hypothetical protein
VKTEGKTFIKSKTAETARHIQGPAQFRMACTQRTKGRATENEVGLEQLRTPSQSTLCAFLEKENY